MQKPQNAGFGVRCRHTFVVYIDTARVYETSIRPFLPDFRLEPIAKLFVSNPIEV